jgi:hypothetical protein
MPGVHSKLYKLQHSPFLEFSAKPTARQVKAETGFSADSLELIWDKYQHFLPLRKRDPMRRQMYFYFVFKYMHMYPTWEQAPAVLWTPALVRQKGCGVSISTLHQQVLTYLAILAVNIDEVHWKNRLSAWNHVDHFATRATVLVDTAPIGVEESLCKQTSSMTYQPKYGDNVFKIQVIHANCSAVDSLCVYRSASRSLARSCCTLGCIGVSAQTILFGDGPRTPTRCIRRS